MRLLLDTVLWLDGEPDKLSQAAQSALNGPGVQRYLSTASIWEIVIKVGIGKLSLRDNTPLRDVLAQQRCRNRLRILPVAADHAMAVQDLPALHKDPFDRMLIAQTLFEDMTIITADTVIPNYPVRTLW
ncbi:MAG: type II toxin-antitoxin system VapC family toxin [Capsulimonadaceae bacterium]